MIVLPTLNVPSDRSLACATKKLKHSKCLNGSFVLGRVVPRLALEKRLLSQKKLVMCLFRKSATAPQELGPPFLTTDEGEG
jgi:hypothetical protein